ncbi:hypothetical protein [Flavobacterium sp.]|uniref:hypothetical protein n=1 Tax=Flavobacterium sp. TaxID=239 RepID=UPI0026311C6D|nr:hypothetical protein [Flavobacterium sp.]
MDRILNIGKWLFPISFLMYVGLHLSKPDVGAAFVPDYLPFPYFLNYLTAVFIIVFIISALIGKYDKLAYTLMALYVVLMAFMVHLPRAIGSELDTAMMADNLAREKELEMVNVFRNIMVFGALLGFARYVAKDKRVTG